MAALHPRPNRPPDQGDQLAAPLQRPRPAHRPSLADLLLMWALIGAALGVLFECSPARAGDRMPRQFAGNWCVVKHDAAGNQYKRGRCSNPDSDGGLKVHGDGYEGHETSCRVLSVRPLRSFYEIKLRCWEEGDISTRVERMTRHGDVLTVARPEEVR